ncbi:MAG: hypothetical protein A2X52_22135 [Candidatus Rokubacteria bacterium GWC2_70_16]|nr:MAG: hypothetical protein A2X52_22135 [Candidatus Rokubacteria bacterium GWC2_70_16]
MTSSHRSASQEERKSPSTITKAAPAMGPTSVPMPPSSAMSSTSPDTLQWKKVGATKLWKEASTAPPTPANTPEMRKARRRQRVTS